MFSQFVSKLSIWIMIILAPPSLAILGTWNTLPGEPLYPIKRGLESVALLVLSPSFKAKSGLQTELISRRTQETTTLIASGNSAAGLQELTIQIQSAQADTQKTTNIQAQKQATINLITKLEKTQTQLETAKQKNAPSPKPTYTPPTKQIPGQPAASNPLPTTAPTTPTAPQTNTVQNIEVVQEEIEETIQELEDTLEEIEEIEEQEYTGPGQSSKNQGQANEEHGNSNNKNTGNSNNKNTGKR